MKDNKKRKSSARKLFRGILPLRPKLLSKNDLKARESVIGANVFGPIMPGERREFFNDNDKSWFFHQEITRSDGTINSRTLHYEVHPTGVLLVGHGFIQGEELKKFVLATELYYERVMSQMYSKNTKIATTNTQLAA